MTAEPGGGFDVHCPSNLTRALAPHGLGERGAQDLLNVVHVTGLNDRDEWGQS